MTEPEKAQAFANIKKAAKHYGVDVTAKSKKDLGLEGHWLIDGIDPVGYAIVVGNVAPIPRFVLLHAFAGRYARACGARWGPDVSITPLSV